MNLFIFLIQIGDGKEVHCRAWEDQASKYKREIRVNQVSRFECVCFYKKNLCFSWTILYFIYKTKKIIFQIICIEKGKVQNATNFNEGNIDYEILIAGFTRITDKIKDKRLGED